MHAIKLSKMGKNYNELLHMCQSDMGEACRQADEILNIVKKYD
jgi:hypothetical protein